MSKKRRQFSAVTALSVESDALRRRVHLGKKLYTLVI
jgi:hypothetical protein